MKITILAVGKVKEPFYRGAVAEFQKRLGKYVKTEIIEVADEKTPDHASEGERCKILEKEAARLMKYIKEDAFVVALAIEGKMIDSLELADKIASLGIGGTSQIQFIIGSSFGLSKRVLEHADMALSFSKMTFPHQLMRVILLEQIYRSYRIIHNEPYHK